MYKMESKNDQSANLPYYYPELYVSTSQVAGRGLFSKSKLPAGTILFKLEGKLIHHDYGPEFAELGPNWVGIGYKKWIVLDENEEAMFLNHCCSPNVMVNPNQEIVALKVIHANDELLLDYSTTELDPYWTMQCNCRSRKCRQVIKSFQYLPYRLQLKYKPYIADVFWNMSKPEHKY
ncbi:MAG: SET domain-containing protein-lysine N-methyltransferase [Daejeonella sp.]